MSVLQRLRFLRATHEYRVASNASRAWIESIARKRLVGLLQHAKSHSPFYKRSLKNIEAKAFRSVEQSLEGIPVLEKEQMHSELNHVWTDRSIRCHDLELFVKEENNLGQWFRNKYCVYHTSGTQSVPLFVVQDRSCLTTIFALMASRSSGDKVSILEGMRRWISPKKISIVSFRRGFYPSYATFEFLEEIVGPLVQIQRLSSMQADLVEQLNRYSPVSLVGYASVLEALAFDPELKLPGLRQISSTGEQLLSSARRRIEERFAVPVADHYGIGECLQLADTCSHGNFHVNSDWTIVEVVDRNNRPVNDGELGDRVLITNLANRVQPFIRYAVEDRIALRQDADCPCGSRFPVIEQMMGRSSDLLWLQNDQNRLQFFGGVLFQTVIDNLHTVRQWRVVQRSDQELRIELELQSRENNEYDRTAHEIQEGLYQSGLPRRVRLSFAEQSIPPDAITGKMKRLVPIANLRT